MFTTIDTNTKKICTLDSTHVKKRRFWWNLAQTSGTWNERSLTLGVKV